MFSLQRRLRSRPSTPFTPSATRRVGYLAKLWSTRLPHSSGMRCSSVPLWNVSVRQMFQQSEACIRGRNLEKLFGFITLHENFWRVSPFLSLFSLVLEQGAWLSR